MGEVTNPQKALGLVGIAGPHARNCCHSSPAGAVSIGPSGIEGPSPSTALCEAATSSARSPPSLGVITADQRCAFAGVWHARRGLVGRIISLGLADRRIWTV